MSRKRGAIVATLVLVAGGAALAVGLASGSARPPVPNEVLAQVVRSFGDHGRLSASVDGAVLTVRIAGPRQGGNVRSRFEARVFAHALATGMSRAGRAPVTSLRLVGSDGMDSGPLERDPNVPPLTAHACESAARGVAQPPLRLVTARTLPFGKGICVFVFRAAEPALIGASFPGVSGRIAERFEPNPGNPDYPYLFELDDSSGRP